MIGRRRALVPALEIGLFVALLGLPDGGLGVVWPSMRAAFGRPIGDLGQVAAALTVPYVAAGLLAGRTVGRVGYGWLAFAVGAVGTVALAAWAAAGAWPFVLLGAAALGWARGSTDSALNAYASEHEGSAGSGCSTAPTASARPPDPWPSRASSRWAGAGGGRSAAWP